jgi:PhnB protein
MSDSIEPSVSISLTVATGKGSEALDFYAAAFGAKEHFRMPDPAGNVAHAEFDIRGTRIFFSEESEEWGAKAMPEGGVASCLFSIDLDDCDSAHAKAVEAGAKVISEPADQFWGARSSIVVDPYGYRWSLHQKTEEVSSEEVMRRAQELFGG